MRIRGEKFLEFIMLPEFRLNHGDKALGKVRVEFSARLSTYFSQSGGHR